MHQQSRQKVLFAGLIAVCIATILLLGALDILTRAGVVRSSEWVAHALTVQREFQALLNAATDAETGQRGFLLTEDDAHLATYERARNRFTSAIAGMRRLTLDNPAQQKRLLELEALVDAKLDLLQQTIALAQSERRADALLIVNTGQGRVLMDQIRTAVQSGMNDEEKLLSERQSAFQAAIGRRATLTRSLLLGLVVIIASALYLLFRVRRLDTFVTMCAWSKTIKIGGEWLTFEEYLHRQFNVRVSHGMAPVEVEKLMAEVQRLEGEPIYRP